MKGKFYFLERKEIKSGKYCSLERKKRKSRKFLDIRKNEKASVKSFQSSEYIYIYLAVFASENGGFVALTSKT